MGGQAATAATFGSIAGQLVIRAGDNPQQSEPAALGSRSRSDVDQDLANGGFFLANASLTANQTGGRLFSFSAFASSVTNRNAPAGQFNAIAAANFVQGFTTASLQWIELTARVNSPPTDLETTSQLIVTRAGQPAPVFVVGHTDGLDVTLNGYFPAGSYTVSGSISTTAAATGTHAGLVDGTILIVPLADFNNTQQVEVGDLTAWKQGYGSLTGAFASGNADGDGDTDGADFLLWQRQLGRNVAVPAASSIPEPAAATMLLAAAVAAAAYCRTRCSAARRASASPAR